MKKLSVILLIILNSCMFFDEKPINEKQMLEKRLKEINWQKVDKFPSINNCDPIKDEELEKKCFFDFLSQTIQEKLITNKRKIKIIPDSLKVKVTIYPNGNIDFCTQNFSEIDSILKVHMVGLPRIYPAIKQGIFVKSEFDLQVIMKSK